VKDDKKKILKNEHYLLDALRTIFAKMRLSNRKFLDPTSVLKKLINSFG
jgi:hypothetical protein